MTVSFTIEVVENGYVIYSGSPSSGQMRNVHVAKTDEDLLEIFKVMRVSERLHPPTPVPAVAPAAPTTHSRLLTDPHWMDTVGYAQVPAPKLTR